MKMDKPEIVLSLYSQVTCNDEYAEKPEFCVIRFTQKDIERIRKLVKALDELEAEAISIDFMSEWYDNRPAFTFEEIGKRFIQLSNYTGDSYEFQKCTDPDEEQSFGRIECDSLEITRYGINAKTLNKYANSVAYESVSVGIKTIEEALVQDEDNTPEEYYFNKDAGDEVPAFKDLPLYVNDSTFVGFHTYACEKMKQASK
jgi:hypothetical protein